MRALPLILLKPITAQLFQYIFPLWLNDLVPFFLNSSEKMSCPKLHVANLLSSNQQLKFTFRKLLIMTNKKPEIQSMYTLRSSIISWLGKTSLSYHQLIFYGLVLHTASIPINLCFELFPLPPPLLGVEKNNGVGLPHSSQ